MMASAVRVASRSFANRSRSFVQGSTTPFVFSSSSLTRVPRSSRVLSFVRSVESLMPLHSAIANARLTSNIAFDSTCWSSLSRVEGNGLAGWGGVILKMVGSNFLSCTCLPISFCLCFCFWKSFGWLDNFSWYFS
ncbi:hypothetical protein ACSQ67_022314 [Phaseolus vulgaris]